MEEIRNVIGADTLPGSRLSAIYPLVLVGLTLAISMTASSLSNMMFAKS